MTILELNIYNTLRAIEVGKMANNIIPTHILLIGDNLLERLRQYTRADITPKELQDALINLEFDNKIHIGETISDQYYKIICPL